MTDLDVSRPVLNGGEDNILDDGEEAETKVSRSPLHLSSSLIFPYRKSCS